jgi:hypothetical protein
MPDVTKLLIRVPIGSIIVIVLLLVHVTNKFPDLSEKIYKGSRRLVTYEGVTAPVDDTLVIVLFHMFTTNKFPNGSEQIP